MAMQTDSYEIMANEVKREHRRMKWFQLQRLLKRKAAFLSLIILVLALMAALFAPVIAPYPDQGLGAVNLEHRLKAPCSSYTLGTDIYGRDMVSRVIFGARISLFGGICIVFFAALIGVPLGLWAGYNEGYQALSYHERLNCFYPFLPH